MCNKRKSEIILIHGNKYLTGLSPVLILLFLSYSSGNNIMALSLSLLILIFQSNEVMRKFFIGKLLANFCKLNCILLDLVSRLPTYLTGNYGEDGVRI